MKRILTFVLSALLMISVLAFVGCGDNANNGEYQNVAWSKIETYILKVQESATLESTTRVEDGYTKIYTVGDQERQVLKCYNQDGVQQLLIEINDYNDDGELEYKKQQYYVDGYFYEKIEEKEDGVWETTKIKQQITFDDALFRTYNKDNDVFSTTYLEMWGPYVAMNEDIKFYMSESENGTKVKVVYKSSSFLQFKCTSTYEYIYDSECRLVEFYGTDDYGDDETGKTEIYKTAQPITFPDLTEFESAGE